MQVPEFYQSPNPNSDRTMDFDVRNSTIDKESDPISILNQPLCVLTHNLSLICMLTTTYI